MAPTNVLFILTDDQGPWAARCYWNPEIRTPNLDRLTASGPSPSCPAPFSPQLQSVDGSAVGVEV